MLNEARDSKGRTKEEAEEQFRAQQMHVEERQDGTRITTYSDGWKAARWEYRGVKCEATRCPRARDWMGEARLPDQYGGQQRIMRSRSLAEMKAAARWIIDRKLPSEDRKGQLGLF